MKRVLFALMAVLFVASMVSAEVRIAVQPDSFPGEIGNVRLHDKPGGNLKAYATFFFLMGGDPAPTYSVMIYDEADDCTGNAVFVCTMEANSQGMDECIVTLASPGISEATVQSGGLVLDDPSGGPGDLVACGTPHTPGGRPQDSGGGRVGR